MITNIHLSDCKNIEHLKKTLKDYGIYILLCLFFLALRFIIVHKILSLDIVSFLIRDFVNLFILTFKIVMLYRLWPLYKSIKINPFVGTLLCFIIPFGEIVAAFLIINNLKNKNIDCHLG